MHWQPSLPSKYVHATDADLAAAIAARKRELGDDLLILGHHYQQDDVIQHADFTGDSLKLSQLAAKEARKRGTKYIVFCGVHFMAETADILSDAHVQVVLPDLAAGCSMADMADLDDTQGAWECLHAAHGKKWNGRIIPITYVNSSAAIKAFVGEHGGACCTSSNALEIMKWALAGGTQPKGADEEIKLLFLPDQHLGRNTASRLGFITEVDVGGGNGVAHEATATLSVSVKGGRKPTRGTAKKSTAHSTRDGSERTAQTVLWDQRRENGGLTNAQIRAASIYLWNGHCSVHKLFRPEHVDEARERFKDNGGITVLVHPECCKDVVDKSDLQGSTEFIINAIHAAKPGSRWFVATETHLVNRLAREAKARGVEVHMLSDCQCLCTTMYRIDQAHLLWALDHLAEGTVVNRVQVEADTAAKARLALDRMLAHVATRSQALPVHVD